LPGETNAIKAWIFQALLPMDFINVEKQLENANALKEAALFNRLLTVVAFQSFYAPIFSICSSL
jgi:hypothetical protein